MKEERRLGDAEEKEEEERSGLRVSAIYMSKQGSFHLLPEEAFLGALPAELEVLIRTCDDFPPLSPQVPRAT